MEARLMLVVIDHVHDYIHLWIIQLPSKNAACARCATDSACVFSYMHAVYCASQVCFSQCLISMEKGVCRPYTLTV